MEWGGVGAGSLRAWAACESACSRPRSVYTQELADVRSTTLATAGASIARDVPPPRLRCSRGATRLVAAAMAAASMAVAVYLWQSAIKFTAQRAARLSGRAQAGLNTNILAPAPLGPTPAGAHLRVVIALGAGSAPGRTLLDVVPRRRGIAFIALGRSMCCTSPPVSSTSSPLVRHGWL